MMISEKINEGIKEAMKSRDQIRLETLRMLKSKILTVDARGNLSDHEVIKLFKTYLGNLQEALEISQSAHRIDMVEKLQKEIKIVQEFLPATLSLEDTKKIALQAMSDTGAKTKKDMGQVMKRIKELNNAVDGKLAKNVLDELLHD